MTAWTVGIDRKDQLCMCEPTQFFHTVKLDNCAKPWVTLHDVLYIP